MTLLRDLLDFTAVETATWMAKRRETNREAILAQQNRRLRRLLSHAAMHSPFYQQFFTHAGIDPAQITSAQQLDSLPLVSRDDFVELGDLMLDEDADITKCQMFTTSGTTGRPLEVIKPRTEWLNDLIRSQIRLRRIGLGPRHFKPFGSAMLYVSDTEYRPQYRYFRQRLPAYNLGYYEKIDIRAEFHEDPLEPVRLISAFAPVVVVGKPSSLRALAVLSQHPDAKNFPIRPSVIMTGAEQLTGEARHNLEEAFQCSVYDTYGLTETGLIGCECRARAGLHFEDDWIIIEVVRNGRRVDPGESGEIVATNLTNLTQPLIRYRTGDMGSVVYEECDCGLAYPRISLIEGRVMDLFTKPNGEVFNPFVLLGDLPNLGLKQYQLIQRTPTAIAVKFIGDADAEIVADAIRGPVHKYMGEAVEVTAEAVERIDEPGRKTRLYVNACRAEAG